MKITVTFESVTRAIVVQRPSLLERLFGRRQSERFAERRGWVREWVWCVGDAIVPEQVETAIEQAWARVPVRARARLGCVHAGRELAGAFGN